MDVEKRYRKAGVTLSAGFKEAPDHIAAELEFMHLLICREMAAIARGNRDDILSVVGDQQAFLENHLNAWVPAFTRQVTRFTRIAFYRHLGEATRLFIAEDTDALSVWCKDETAAA